MKIAGNMPVRVLRYNVDYKFNNIRPEVTSMLRNEFSVEKEIINTIDQLPITGPFADETNHINISENYTAYLWCVCYYFFITQEHIQSKIGPKWDGKIDYNENPILRRAWNLFKWAISLNNEYSEWDLNLPNPESYNSFEAKEKEYIEKVNGLYTSALVYVMFHEFCHISNGHTKNMITIRKKYKELGIEKYSDYSIEDRALIKEMEAEADSFAFEVIIKHFDSELDQFLKNISLVLKHIADLFMVKNVLSIQQVVHPDLDTRLFHAATKNIYPDHEFYLKSLTCLGMRLFYAYENIKIEQSKFESVDEQLYTYLKIFDDIKEGKIITEQNSLNITDIEKVWAIIERNQNLSDYEQIQKFSEAVYDGKSLITEISPATMLGMSKELTVKINCIDFLFKMLSAAQKDGFSSIVKKSLERK